MLESFFFHRHLDDEEVIRLVVHKHWLLGLRELFWPSALFAGAWLLLVSIPDTYVFYAVAIISMASTVWWIRNFLDYYLDTWIITNKGVIDLEWHGWFHRESSRILYSDIEAVSYEIQGIVQTLLNIGDIAIEKISTGEAIAMPFVKKPKQVERVILECLENYMHSKNLKDAKTVQNILAEFVAGSMQKDAAEKSRS